MKTFIFLATVVVVSQAVTYTTPMLKEWASFKTKYDKSYQTESENKLRMKIYFDNKRYIEEHNARFEKGLITFTLGVNKFADMTNAEFTKTVLNFNASGNTVNNTEKTVVLLDTLVEDSIDWRDKGAVTPIKDQRPCDADWAFSAVVSLEGAHFLAGNPLISLSEQQLIDCSDDFGNDGCNGGLSTSAFDYTISAGGIELQSDYPYTAKHSICKSDKTKFSAAISGYDYIDVGSESDLKTYVGSRGPVSAAVDASHSSFQFYQSGIYFEMYCSSEVVNHAVGVVGYGDGFWLVKNSWGTEWGEKGYIRMARDRDNNCGIATICSIAKV